MARWSREKKYRKRRAFLMTGIAVLMLIVGCATGNGEYPKISALFFVLSINDWVGLLTGR